MFSEILKISPLQPINVYPSFVGGVGGVADFPSSTFCVSITFPFSSVNVTSYSTLVLASSIDVKLMLIFLAIYIAFVAVALNYAKAFRVKNSIIDMIKLIIYL